MTDAPPELRDYIAKLHATALAVRTSCNCAVPKLEDAKCEQCMAADMLEGIAARLTKSFERVRREMPDVPPEKFKQYLDALFGKLFKAQAASAAAGEPAHHTSTGSLYREHGLKSAQQFFSDIAEECIMTGTDSAELEIQGVAAQPNKSPPVKRTFVLSVRCVFAWVQ